MHLVPSCPAHVLLPLLVLFYNMFELINNQLINQMIWALFGVGTHGQKLRLKGYSNIMVNVESLATKNALSNCAIRRFDTTFPSLEIT